jgi:hypothetical protein
MVEHAGLRNLGVYFDRLFSLLRSCRHREAQTWVGPERTLGLALCRSLSLLQKLTSDKREGLLKAQSGPFSPRNCKFRS